MRSHGNIVCAILLARDGYHCDIERRIETATGGKEFDIRFAQPLL